MKNHERGVLILFSLMMVVSAGVVEDISFDIELMNNFQAKLFLIDPTPRAISYIQKIINNFITIKSSIHWFIKQFKINI